MASVPITVLHYNDPLLCGFNVRVKGLKCWVLAPGCRGYDQRNCSDRLRVALAVTASERAREWLALFTG